jgi:flavin-dependent dehydrogenase
MQHTEVLIVGGGPAGAACAWRLRQRGVDCLILDRQRFPRLKPCAGWITPQVLRDLDLDAADYGGSLTTFRALHISIRGFQFRLPTRQYAIRRWEFDHWMLHRTGVPVRQHTVQTIARTGEMYVVDGAYAAKYLVGAGGTHCPVYRTLFQEGNPRDKGALIVTLEQEFRYAYRDARCCLWFLEEGLPGYAWYVPKANGADDRYPIVNVGIGGKAEALRAQGDRLKQHWALLVDKLDRLGLVRGHVYRPRGYAYYLRPADWRARPEVRRDNALIAGDAVGLATLDMGEGIGPAVRSGLLAAEAILHDTDYDLRAIPRLSLLPSVQRFLAGRRQV